MNVNTEMTSGIKSDVLRILPYNQSTNVRQKMISLSAKEVTIKQLGSSTYQYEVMLSAIVTAGTRVFGFGIANESSGCSLAIAAENMSIPLHALHYYKLQSTECSTSEKKPAVVTAAAVFTTTVEVPYDQISLAIDGGVDAVPAVSKEDQFKVVGAVSGAIQLLFEYTITKTSHELTAATKMSVDGKSDFVVLAISFQTDGNFGILISSPSTGQISYTLVNL